MLDAFSICRRRFQLRYLEKVPWPAMSTDPEVEKAKRLGEKFHQMVRRHFLGVPGEAGDETQLEEWWNGFLAWESQLPSGNRYPEFTITVPLGNHYLTGRMDLLIVEETRVHIFDWKTTKLPGNREQLWNDLQTKFYLTLVVKGAASIGRAIDPEEVALSYWYAHDPPQIVVLQHDATRQERYWKELQESAARIDHMLDTEVSWPLTEDLSACRRCPYQIICQREVGSADLAEWDMVETEAELDPQRY